MRDSEIEKTLFIVEGVFICHHKTRGVEKEGCLLPVRQLHLYEAIKSCSEECDNLVELCCEILHVFRSTYYKWLKGNFGKRIRENERIAEKIEEI